MQVAIGVLRDVDDAAVGRDELDADQVVGGEAVLRHQPTEPAAEREPRDAGRRDRAARRRESVHGRLAVELAPERTALRARRLAGRVDVDALHRREVDHQRIVGDGAPGDVVAAAANRDVEALRASEADRVGDVRGVPAARDQRRPPVDHPVVDTSRVVVLGVSGVEDAPGKRLAKGVEALAGACRGCHKLPPR